MLPGTRAAHPSSSSVEETSAPAEPLSPRSLLRGLWRPAIVILLIAVVVVLVQPARIVDNIAETRQWFRALGLVGIALFFGFYVIAAVCLVPQSALKVAAGAVFGAALGVVVASVGATIGATACFLIARYVARGTLLQRLKKRPAFRRLDHMTGEHGPIIVATSRLIPIFPGNLLNYAFGITRLRTKTFVVWSWLCMLPGTVALVVGTDAAVQAVEDGRVPWGLVAVVGGALALMIVATRMAYRQYRDKQGDADRDQPAG